MPTTGPSLTVIIKSYLPSPNLRLVLGHLKAQTVARDLELILVVPHGFSLEASPEDWRGFSAWRVIQGLPGENNGGLKARGVAAASAPLVAFLEDHSKPAPTWAQALCQAHQQGEYAVVGPIISNANPHSAVSRGGLLIFYGPYLFPAPPPGPRSLPGSHSCYRRQALLSYGDRLGAWLENESLLHADFLARGWLIRQEPTARVGHLNWSRVTPLVMEQFFYGRVFAAGRSRTWSLAKRAAYALGSPLIPLVRLNRALGHARQAAMLDRRLLTALPSMVFNLCAGAAGEMLGYAWGPGNSARKLLELEAGRHSWLSPRDLDDLARG